MSEVVKAFYDRNAEREWQRLVDPYSKIEFASTLGLIRKYAPKSGNVCDIGAGPGRYAVELLGRGYQVTLMELSSKELEIAKQRIEEAGLAAEAYICDNALHMECLRSNHYDMVLMMGPLYHLHSEADRMHVIRETYRILKDDGIAIFAYINAWGCLKAGVTEFPETFRDKESIYEYLGELQLDANRGFTECYFTTPPQALREVTACGFDMISYAGAEGFLAGIQTEVFRLSKEEPQIYANLVEAAADTCELPQYRDATEHLHIVARKNSSNKSLW